MPTIQNVSPIGDLDVPLLRRIVKRDEIVEVTAAQALRLLPQGIWLAVDDDAQTIQTEIDHAADDTGVDQEGVSE